MSKVTVERFAILSTKECMVPDDPYYIPSYIKDAELSAAIRSGDTVTANKVLELSVPVCYAHDGGFYYQRDHTQRRNPPRRCLTPLVGYVRAALLCANPPKDPRKPNLDVLRFMLDHIPKPEVKSGRDEEYCLWMVVDVAGVDQNTGRSCISDLTLLSLLRRIPWTNREEKSAFLTQYASRYAVLDSLEAPSHRQIYIDDMVRTHDYGSLVKFLQQDSVAGGRNVMLKKFYEEDPSTAFPYYAYGWFRCFVVLMRPDLLEKHFKSTRATLSVSKIATDACGMAFMPEYQNDSLKFPCIPFTPGTRGHYFCQWIFAADSMILVEDECTPERFPDLVNSAAKRKTPDQSSRIEMLFSTWKKF